MYLATASADMALRDGTTTNSPSRHPLAEEFGIVTAMVVGLFLFQRTIAEGIAILLDPPPARGGIVIGGLLSGLILVASVAVFAHVYTSARGIPVRRSMPARSDLSTVVLAGVAPVALAGTTKLIGGVTGVPYNALTMTSYAADAPYPPVALLAGVSIAVSVPILVIVTQVLIQGSFARVVNPDEAIVVTTVIGSVVLTSSTGSVTAIPEPERVVGIVCFALLGGIALYATDRFEGRDRRRYLAFVPLAAFSLLVLLSGIAAIGSIAEGMYAITHVATFGVAAYAYDRTDSPVAPAIAYTSLLAADTTIVYLFEAGMQSW